MNKIILSKPVVVAFYGFPGSGKSYLARNLTDEIEMAQVSGDRIRNELFEHPRYDAQENAIIAHLMRYMAEEFLNAGVSVAYDTNALRSGQRQGLRELARRAKADYLLIWLQIDPESSFNRTQNRDRRTSDDKYAEPLSRLSFDKQVSGMQNPQGEDYLVVSGKHTFTTQKGAIVNRFYNMGLTTSETVRRSVAKPGLVNLVPNLHAGRVDYERRNISIG